MSCSPGLQAEGGSRRNAPWGTMLLEAKSSAEQEVKMILLALEFRACKHAQAASLMASPGGTLAFPLSL